MSIGSLSQFRSTNKSNELLRRASLVGLLQCLAASSTHGPDPIQVYTNIWLCGTRVHFIVPMKETGEPVCVPFEL